MDYDLSRGFKTFVLEETKISEQAKEVYRTLISLGNFNEYVLFVQPDFHGAIQIHQLHGEEKREREEMDSFFPVSARPAGHGKNDVVLSLRAGQPQVKIHNDNGHRVVTIRNDRWEDVNLGAYPSDLKDNPELSKEWLTWIDKRLKRSRRIVGTPNCPPIGNVGLLGVAEFVPYKPTSYKTRPGFEEQFKSLVYENGSPVFPCERRVPGCSQFHASYEYHCYDCFEVIRNTIVSTEHEACKKLDMRERHKLYMAQAYG